MTTFCALYDNWAEVNWHLFLNLIENRPNMPWNYLRGGHMGLMWGWGFEFLQKYIFRMRGMVWSSLTKRLSTLSLKFGFHVNYVKVYTVQTYIKKKSRSKNASNWYGVDKLRAYFKSQRCKKKTKVQIWTCIFLLLC